MNSRRHLVPKPSFALVCLVAFALYACGGCGACAGCGDENELEKIADNFPEDTQFVYAAPSLEKLMLTPRQAVESDRLTDEQRDDWQQLVDDAVEQLEGEFGFDPTDLDAWRQAGIDPEGPIFGAVIDIDAPDDELLCMHLQDRDDFESFAVDTLAGDILQLDDASHDNTDFDGHEVHTAGDELAWGYIGDAVCVASEPGEQNADEMVAELMEGPGDANSLNDNPAFATFRDEQINDSVLSFYSEHDLGFWEGFFEEADTTDETYEEVVGAFRGYGVSTSVDDDVLDTTIWAGLNDDPLAETQQAFSPHQQADWDRFATDDTSAVLRLTVNPQYLFELFEARADDDLIDEFEQTRREIHLATTGRVDLEEDIIDNLSGQLGVFLYGIRDTSDPFELGMISAAQNLELLVVAQFVDDEALADIFDIAVSVLEDEVPGSLRPRPVRKADGTELDDTELVEIPLVGLKLVRAGDLLLGGTGVLSEAEIAAFLEGERAGDSIADTGSGIGSRVESDSFNGLYLSGDAWGLTESLLEAEGIELQELDLADYYDEAVVYAEPTDSGVNVGAEISPPEHAILHGLLPALIAEAQ